MNCGYPFFTNNLIKLVLKIHLSNHWLLFVVKNPNPWIMAGGRPCGRPFGDHVKLQIPQWALKRTNPNKRLGSMGYNPLMSFFVFFFTSAAWVESSLFQFEIYIYIHAFPEWYHAFPWISWLLTFSSVWGLLNSYPHDLTVGSICWVMYCWSPLWIWIGSPCYANSPTNSAVNAGNSLSVSWLLRWTSGIAALWKLGWSATSNPRFWGSNAPTHKSLS